MMQDRPASILRNSTARKIPLRSPQNERRIARLSGPGFSVTTRKIAARVSGATIGCATACAALGALFGSESIVYLLASYKWQPTSHARAGRWRMQFELVRRLGAQQVADEVVPAAAGHITALGAVAVVL